MKKYLITYLIIISLVIVAGYIIFKVEYNLQEKELTQESIILLNEQSDIISDNLYKIASDISYLSRTKDITSATKVQKHDLLEYIKHNSIYDQLRIINLAGNEIFRINQINNQAQIVAKKDLQSKKNRYYIDKALELKYGEFYISPLDLNIENGKVELPKKPTIRIATVIFDAKGIKKGIIVLNVLYKKLLDDLQASIEKKQAQLLLTNAKGNWLIAANKKDSWGFMFEDKANQLKNFNTHLWENIQKNSDGIVSDSKSLYYYKTINPLEIIFQKNHINNISDTFKNGLKSEHLRLHFIIATPKEVIFNRTFNNVKKGIPYSVIAIFILLILVTYLIRLVDTLLLQTEKLTLSASCFINSDDGMVITDAQTKILQVNPRYKEITGYEESELLGSFTNKLSSGLTTKEKYMEIWKSINDFGKWQGEVRDRKKDGSVYIQWLRIVAIKSTQGDIKNYLGVTTDITHKRDSDQKIYTLAYKDPITGLANRKLFKDELSHSLILAKLHKRSVAVISLDIDNFKLINDTAGHRIGDLFLNKLALHLQSCIGEDDTLSRFGGDEFFILMDFADEQKVCALGQKILESFRSSIAIDEHEYFTSCSMGIALYPNDAVSVDELLQHADTAMYRAKEEGKHRYKFFATEMNRESHRRLSIEKNLKTAIEKDEFILFFQPQISLETKTINGAESLIRWKNLELGYVSPAEFIPIAESSDTIIPLTMWVIKQSCEMLKIVQKKHKDLTIAVNISSKHIVQENFSEEIFECVQSQGICPTQLELEITEGSLIDDIEDTVIKLNKLKSYGFRIAIDDFGTGYSSLSYLKKFGFNKLKIDQAFIRDLPHDAEDTGITKSIIAISKVLNMKVIAEGAETLENIQFLEQNSCDLIQGYYFSKPLPKKEFLEYCDDFQYS